MGIIRNLVRFRGFFSASLIVTALLLEACNQPDSGGGGTGSVGSILNDTSSSSSAPSNTSNVMAFQIITKASPSGSFDSPAVPAAGGISVKTQRLYNLDGSLITTGNVPTWYADSRVFLTSTRTAGTANPVSPSGSDTPCAYFDSFADNNPDTSGFYTIDGFNPTAPGVVSDIDQCAGTAAAELNQLGMYIRVDRRFMNPTDKLQIIVKAKPIEVPNTAPTSSSCVVGGFFDASACSNQLYTLTMRTAPGAAAKPFYILFPSAKALDLLSESVLLPIHIDTSITTISIDRVKGGAVFYGISVIRML